MFRSGNPEWFPVDHFRVLFAVAGEPVVSVIRVKLPGEANLFEVIDAFRFTALFLGLGKRDEQKGREDGDDRDDHEELDQGKAASAMRAPYGAAQRGVWPVYPGYCFHYLFPIGERDA